jgi:hypothetical protein
MTALVLVIPAALLVVGGAVLLVMSRLVPGSARRRNARREEQPLAHELPYWSLFEDQETAVAVNVDLTYSSALALRGLDVDCIDGGALEQVTEGLHGLLVNLPAGVVVQFLHWTDGDVSQ